MRKMCRELCCLINREEAKTSSTIGTTGQTGGASAPLGRKLVAGDKPIRR
jgi:hypothetical protein